MSSISIEIFHIKKSKTTLKLKHHDCLNLIGMVELTISIVEIILTKKTTIKLASMPLLLRTVTINFDFIYGFNRKIVETN